MEPAIAKELRLTILDLMVKERVSKSMLAKKCGFSSAHICNMLNKKSSMSLNAAAKMLEMLNYDLHFIPLKRG